MARLKICCSPLLGLIRKLPLGRHDERGTYYSFGIFLDLVSSLYSILDEHPHRAVGQKTIQNGC
jgi:hypothetical protein